MSKVVIIVSGGMVQSVMTDSEDIETLVLDCDCEGGDSDDVQQFLDDEEQFEAVPSNQKDVLPDRVESLFNQACV